ncbi:MULTISPECIES: NnrU family protein [Aeromonas]|uniref:NnrU family protein n=1 Tax=Aeromonas TaxID=642 RepID=UPI001C2457D1|nr:MULTISPECIES: NnrU family protein [Aeromonas]MCO4203546.1 NnrU family protein [Aeromonas taiwanensis]QXB55457.1 NnrU family protein [Aeromonas sp. FDAARGOS 1415]
MILLTLGVVLFTLIHLYPCFAAAHRARLRERLGENRYKGLFSLLVFVAIACILAGWRSASPLPLYPLPDWGPTLTMAAMPLSLILLCSGQGQNHLRRWLVHPQLLGALLWAGAHLTVNSEARSLVLFGGIGLWALVSIVWISVRDWQQKPRPEASWQGTGISLGAGLAITALLIFWGHGWLTGIPLH